ncbi:S8 family serine peptidase [Clostridium sp.]|uniref:S8 family serine peptidase n=1 Tax=Clostridium sp. TaxID=1506 RepID=UPI002FC8C6ED
MRKNKIKKLLAIATVSCMLMNSSISAFAQTTSVEMNQLQTDLTGLTPEQQAQLDALEMFKLENEFTISPKINVKTSEPVRIIVEFKQAPAKVHVIKEKLAGKKVSLSDAKKKVDESHKKFKEHVEKMEQQKKEGKKQTPSVDISNHSIKITKEYKHAFNGVAMTLPGNEVEELLSSDLVARIYEDRVVQLDLVGTNDTTNKEVATTDGIKASSTYTSAEKSIAVQSIAEGTLKENTIPLPGIDKLHEDHITGEGIKVGVLDTGVDYNHPDLTDAYKGYRYKDGEDSTTVEPTSVKGWDFVDNDADPMETTYEDWINAGSPIVEGRTYYTSHGTHVSGTIAAQGENQVEYPAQGVAPDVDLYVYRVLGPYGGGYASGIIAGIDKSVQDGMDVINLSLGNSVNDPLIAESVAINNATIVGVTCVVAAGNSGPNEGTLGSPGTAALGISVGASDFPMAIPTGSATVGSETFNNMKLLGRGFGDDLNSLVNHSYPVVYVGLGGADDFKDASGQAIDLTGKVALIQRGTYLFADKVKNAKLAGAEAVIIYNNVDGEIDFYVAEQTEMIPTFRMTNADGERLKAAASTSSITFTSIGSFITEGNHLASFSSRGPVAGSFDIKPDVVGPGVSVYSTYPEYVHSPEAGIDYTSAYSRISGTSMATPHVAGIAALILQAHPDYTPAEVKEVMQNTADKLNGDYSVYEVGAGLVDVTEAVHSEVAIEVLNKTLNYDTNSGINKFIDDKTGSLVFNTVYKQATVSTVDLPVSIKNNGTQAKQFDISFEYSNAKTGVVDAVTNNVSITTSVQTVSVEAKASSNLTATIHVPGTAQSGRYEGYVNIVNHSNPEEKYRLPFAVFNVEKGIGSSSMTNPAISQVMWQPAHPFMQPPGLAYLKYKLNSPMKSARLFLYDKDGVPLGSSTTREDTSNQATKILNQNINAGLDTQGYYPFIGDPKDEKTDINLPKARLTPGEYQLKLKLVDIDGITTYETPMYKFIIDNTLPSLTFKDHAPGKVYELKDSDFTTETWTDGNAYNGFWIHTNLYDEGTAKLASSGVTQSDNKLWYYFNQKWVPDGDFPVDANGDTKFAIEKQDIANGPATVILFPMDKAGNAHLLNEFYPYAFIKEGSPYMVPTYDKDKVYLNDTLKMTLNLNNVEKLMSGSYDFNYYHDYFQFMDVKVNPEFQKYADEHGLTVTVDDPVFTADPTYIGHKTIAKVGAQLSGGEGFSGDIPFLDVTFKLFNDEFNILWDAMNGDKNTTTFSYTKFGETTPTDITAFNQIDSYKIIPKHSYVVSYVRLEGVGAPLNNAGISKYVTSVYAKGSDGNKYQGVVGFGDGKNYIDIHGIPLSNDPYEIIVEAPGYLKSIQKVKLGTKTTWGEDVGEIKYIMGSQPTSKAGDVNCDGIIDVLDAKQVYEKLGQQNSVDKMIEDFNKDGIVDKKDMQSVANNIYKSNPDVTVSPKEVINVDGVDMYATNYFNMAKVYSAVNTFKVTSKNTNTATLNWLAVDPAGVWGGVKIQQQSSTDGVTWPDNYSWTYATLETPITVSSTSAVVNGLSENTFYRFRLVVEGGLNGTLNGGYSNVVTMKTTLAPNAPTVNEIDDNDTIITGKAVANGTIFVKNNNETVGTGQTDADGNYQITISPQIAGSVLLVTVIDAIGSESKATSVTVLDRTAPDAPAIDVIDDNDEQISGYTEVNATITVKKNGEIIGTGKADTIGLYNIPISKQSAGTIITVSSTDAAGNQSQETSITVLDRTAPEILKIDIIDDNEPKIFGVSEMNASITVKLNGETIGTGKANAVGEFMVKIRQQKAGTVLLITATDEAGNESSGTEVTVVDKKTLK